MKDWGEWRQFSQESSVSCGEASAAVDLDEVRVKELDLNHFACLRPLMTKY